MNDAGSLESNHAYENLTFTHISLPDLFTIPRDRMLQSLVIADSGTLAQRMESENGKDNA